METDKQAIEETTQTKTEVVPRWRAVRRLMRAETAYATTLLVFAVLAMFAYFNAYFGWDLRVSRALQAVPLPGMLEFMRAVSTFGNRLTPFALTTLTVIILFVFRKRTEAAGLLLSAGGSALLNTIVKRLIGRPRPTDELVTVYRDLETLSFPSGHVTFYVTYFGFLFFVAYALLPRGSALRRLALILTALPVLLVGFSRVYLGAHWPSDTLGAYLLSGVWLGFSLDIYRRWKQRTVPADATDDNFASDKS
jgi:membrane-associated phospholipid phosphatase